MHFSIKFILYQEKNILFIIMVLLYVHYCIETNKQIKEMPLCEL